MIGNQDTDNDSDSGDTSWTMADMASKKIPIEKAKIQSRERSGQLIAELELAKRQLEQERMRTSSVQTRVDRQKTEADNLRKQADLDHQALRAELLAERDEWQQKYITADSQRRILELEHNRPLREKAKLIREAQEKEDKEKRVGLKRKAEGEHMTPELLAEEERRALVEKEKEEMERRLERQERERRERQALQERRRFQQWGNATTKEQKRCRKRDQLLWGKIVWTDKRALERFEHISSEFKQTKFSEVQPLTFYNIPWPLLVAPEQLEINCVEWANILAFFVSAQATLAPKEGEYDALIEKAHQMFSPDRWRSRKILITVIDEKLRSSLEEAGNVVLRVIDWLQRDN